MGIINWTSFGGILVDLIIIGIIIINIFDGYKRGLTQILFKVITFFVALIVVSILHKPFTSFIINTTQIDEKIASTLQISLSQTTLLDGELIPENKYNVSSSITNFINSLATEAINNAETELVPYVATQLSHFIIKVIVTLILFILCNIGLSFVRVALEFISRLPIISAFDKSGGLIYGILKSFLIIYITLAIFSILSPLITNWSIISSIDNSKLGSKMYNNNIIVNFFAK